MTLEEARSEARAHAPETAELEARVRGAEILLEDASRRLRHDPSLSIDFSPASAAGTSAGYSATVGARFPIDVSGSWSSRKGSAEADLERTRYDREDALRALDEAVDVAFAQLAAAQRAVTSAKRVSALFELAVDAERQRFEVGQGNRIDLDAAEIDAADARAGLEQARGAVETTRVALARLMACGLEPYLEVEDPDEPSNAPDENEPDAVIERDPRVRAAEAEAHAMELAVRMNERLMWPVPTVGVDFITRRSDIPEGSFHGPSSAGLSAAWPEKEVVLSLGVPIPIFEGAREPRAQARAASLGASARVAIVRSNVRAELQQAWAAYMAAANAHRELVPTAAIISRDFELLGRAVESGAMDAVARGVALRRLEAATRRLDLAVLELRVARASWLRQSRSR
ncbi:Heavy metal RND efflux outer membrane protein, CzcC family [Vulgatibacter incomptus]|uniref:Heavy metal RND efflux outer membrane protein, CzcC family n=2 Tax=Vulgatibacter incomptus TaxID=1391653 RepID=A0A0K1PHZ0_9BACT|nr:Heavy metal RND efflux outer membrane protein, CzcC family [Vulgatibacter incomptus]